MDTSKLTKRNGLGKNRQKKTTEESSGGSEREVERLNERGRKPMKHNFHRWGGGRASIAGEPLLPGEAPMSTLCTGFERRGRRLRVNERFRGPNGDQHGLRAQELDEGPSERTSWPIAKAAPAEPEQEGRLVPVQQEETLGPPRRLAQHLLGVKQQEERCAARRRRSPGAASSWNRILDTVRAVGKGDNGQCGPHITRAASRCAPACVLAWTADGLPGSAASHRVAA
jgi:hypothetical protein